MVAHNTLTWCVDLAACLPVFRPVVPVTSHMAPSTCDDNISDPRHLFCFWRQILGVDDDAYLVADVDCLATRMPV